jgi:hypothetical protein
VSVAIHRPRDCPAVRFKDAELLQAWAPWFGDSIVEVARAVKSDTAQGEVGEMVEDALGMEDEAFIP